jgi:hypothetical protein
MSRDPRDFAPKGRPADNLPRPTACPRCQLLEATIVCRLCKADKRPIPTSANEPGYWEEKAAEDRQMYREEQARELQRAFPERRP